MQSTWAAVSMLPAFRRLEAEKGLFAVDAVWHYVCLCACGGLRSIATFYGTHALLMYVAAASRIVVELFIWGW